MDDSLNFPSAVVVNPTKYSPVGSLLLAFRECQLVWISARFPGEIVIGSSARSRFDWSGAVRRKGYPVTPLLHVVLLRWINWVRLLDMVMFGGDKNTVRRNGPPARPIISR